MPVKNITITTDGSCHPNPGFGGWAAILRFGTFVREITGGEANTTNNRMELLAVVEALAALREPCRVVLRTDSENTIAWCRPLAFAKPKRRAKFPEAFALAQRFQTLASVHSVIFEKVAAHTGDPDNERCDELAAEARRIVARGT